MRKSNEQSLKEVIDNLLDTYKLRGKINETRVLDAWRTLMGNAVNQRTTELYVSNRKLFVRLTSSVLRQELSMGRDKLCNMVNEHIGYTVIDEVVLL